MNSLGAIVKRYRASHSQPNNDAKKVCNNYKRANPRCF